VGSTKKSSKHQDGSITLPLVKDAVPLSIQIGEPLFRGIMPETVMGVMLLLIRQLTYEMASSDQLFLSFSAVRDQIDKMPDKEGALKVFEKLVLLADRSNKMNPIRGMF
jgi:hypothetical protein